MLVLTRKIGEEIIIGDSIRISIVECANGRVKIGVVAPKSVSVDRREVHDRKQQEDFDKPVVVSNHEARPKEKGELEAKVHPREISETEAVQENRIKHIKAPRKSYRTKPR